MRSFEDAHGGIWDAAVERASYGAHFLIFAGRRTGELRRAMLGAATFDEAQRELAALSETDLRERLAAADAWDQSP